MNRDRLVTQCRSLVPLSSLRQQHLLVALEEALELTTLKGDVLFAESEAKDSLFYLLSGEVLLRHHDGNERIITADFHWLPIVQYQSESFSATAITDCELLRFDRYQLDNLLCWSQAADYIEIDISYEREFDDDADWMTTILNSNLFYKIPPLNVFFIFSKVDSVPVDKAQTILQQGEEGDYCYFIKEGKAQVLRAESEGDVPKPIAEIGIGQCFGEDALIENTVRNATVKMLTSGTLMRIKKEDFEALLIEPSVDHLNSATLQSANEQSYELLDVRTQEEFDYRHLTGAMHIPLTLLRLKIRLLDPEKHYLVYCNTGARSRATAFLLSQKGFKVSVLQDGLGSISQEQVDRLLVSDFEDIHQQASGQQ